MNTPPKLRVPWLRYDPIYDWVEDFHLENGNYCNQCIFCKRHFLGYKRRIICKSCAFKEEEDK